MGFSSEHQRRLRRKTLGGLVWPTEHELQLESTPKRWTGFEKLVWPESILQGECAEVDIPLQLESAPERWIGFEKLVWPESILQGEYSEIAVLLLPESRAVEFRELSIR